MRAATCHPLKKHYSRGLCEACYMTEFRRSRPEYRQYMKTYLKKYREENPGKIAIYTTKRRADPLKRERDARNRKNSAYKNNYGITLNEALDMLAKQGNACALCKISLNEKSMNVDHCHKDGHVRGILCGKCNRAIGQLGDTIEAVSRALAYLLGSDRKTELLAGQAK